MMDRNTIPGQFYVSSCSHDNLFPPFSTKKISHLYSKANPSRFIKELDHYLRASLFPVFYRLVTDHRNQH